MGKRSKINVVLFFFLVAFLGILFAQKSLLFAEQSGSSPDSGATTSRIKTLYDALITLGVGSTSSGAWGDWGAMWNRIYSVSSIDYSNQSLVEYDDYEYGGSLGVGDTGTEESSWTNTATNVWKDSRTGLYWSNSQGQFSNIFPDQGHSTCDFFTTTPRGSYGIGSTDPDCGNAINKCGTLSLEVGNGGDAETDWYLPSQKELMQAYIDGIYNQAGSSFTTTSNFWSSTERSDNPTNAWYVTLFYGNTNSGTKTTATHYVRCVRRD